jgi:hypothetical protein
MVPVQEQKRFRNRKGNPSEHFTDMVSDTVYNIGYISQNVLAFCDFNMLFTYVLSGWEGSASDGSILEDAKRRFDFAIPDGLMDVLDAGFPLTKSSLTPYRGVRYHLKEWHRGNERCYIIDEYVHLNLNR